MSGRSQQDADQLHKCEVLVDQLQRKTELADAGRARMLAARKAAMLGCTRIQSLAEQRKKASQRLLRHLRNV